MALEVRKRVRPGPSPKVNRGSKPPAPGASADDKPGYKKPPRHTQFKPGESGNPKGRPAGSKNVNTLIERELDQKVVVREGGRSVQLTKREVLVKQLVKKAIEGDHRSQQTLLKRDQELAAAHRSANDNAASAETPLDQDDRAILDAYVAMVKGHAAEESTPEDAVRVKATRGQAGEDNGEADT